MNQIVRFLPAWTKLQKLDDYFLLNNRLLWISKPHYVLYFGLLTTIVFSSIALSMPISLSAGVPNWSPFFVLSIITGLLGFVVWAYRQTIYNIEKNFGNISKFFAIKTLFINILCIAVFFAITILPTYVFYSRASGLVTQKQVFDDIETLKAVNFAFTCAQKEDDYYTDNMWSVNKDSESYGTDLKNSYEQSKSYFLLWGYYPKYEESGKGYTEETSNPNQNEIIKDLQAEIKKELTIENISAYLATAKKYGVDFNTTPQEVLQAFNEERTLFPIETRELKYKVLQNMNSFYSAHKEVKPYLQYSFYVIIFCIIYYIAMTVMLYKSMKAREFLLALAAGFLLFPCLIAFSEAFRLEKEIIQFSFLALCIGGFFTAIQARKRFSRIALMATSYSQVLLPFSALVLIDSYGNESLWIFFVVLLIHALSITPVYHNFYLHSRALPRN